MEYVYRFRSTDALLSKHNELENQEIHLAAPSELNDPMEGYQDVFWDGDELLWRNLLNHYILVLTWAASDCQLQTADEFCTPKLPARLSLDHLPTDAFRALVKGACNDFFSDENLARLPADLAALDTPLHAAGLLLVLMMIHGRAFEAVMARLQRLAFPDSITPTSSCDFLPNLKEFFDGIRAAPKGGGDEPHPLDGLGLVTEEMIEQQALRAILASGDQHPGTVDKALFAVNDFPALYVKSLVDDLIYPAWYTACFSTTCVNASMWSTYADEHRGVALKFRPTYHEGKPTLRTTGPTGTSVHPGCEEGEVAIGTTRSVLHQVKYAQRAPRVDFFRMLGRLPRAQLERQWYANSSGQPSPHASEHAKAIGKWRADYWESLREMACTKLEDWSFEQEYRLVMPDPFNLHVGQHRNIKYDFAELAGIVFGLRTPRSAQAEIARIILTKCEDAGHKNVTMERVRYFPAKGRLVVM